MRLAWHIVQKDFRRLAAPLALWALLLVVRGEIGVHVLTSPGIDLNHLFYWSIANTVLLWIDAIVCLLLAAALVHEDSLVGFRAGWVTRPISGARLLTAKLLGAVLMFGVLPLLIALRWWLACGYGGAEMLRAALALADVQAVTVFGAVLLAVVTSNINHFLGWLLGLGVAAIAWIFALSLIVKADQVEVTRGVGETRSLLFLTVCAVGGVAVILVQFLTRQRGRALAIAGAAAAIIGIGFASGWDFSSAWARPPRTSLLASGITVTVEHPKIEQRGELNYVLQGVSADYGVGASVDHVWRWNDGKIAAAQSGWTAGSWPGQAEWRLLGPHRGTENALMMQAYNASAPKGAIAKDTSIVPTQFLLWADKAERLRTEPATYVGEAHVTLYRPALELELPLQAGAKREQAGASVRIDRIEWREGAWRVTLVESRPTGATYGRHRPGIAMILGGNTSPATGFALVNRARGEAIRLWGGSMPRTQFFFGSQEVDHLELGCGVPPDPAAQNRDTPPAWLKDATLAVIRYREEATFDREVKVENFGGPEALAAIK